MNWNREDFDMLRRRRAASGADNPAASPAQSNFSVRFNVKSDSSNEVVDITPDQPIGDPAATTARPARKRDAPPPPPRSVFPENSEVPSPPPRRVFSPDLNLSRAPNTASAPSPDPPSASGSVAGTPVVDRVSSFRDNLHNLRERFSHRKNSDTDDRSIHATQAPGDQTSGIFGKLAKKIEDRRSSHKDSPSGASTPMRDSDVPTTLHKSSCSSHSLPGLAENGNETKKVQPAVVESPSERFSPTSQSFMDVPGEPELLADAATAPQKPPPFPVEPRLSYAEGAGVKPIRNPEAHRGSIEPELPGRFTSLPIIILIGLLTAVVAVPMPSFMSGLLFGCIITAAASVRIWFTVLFPRKPKDKYRLPSTPSALIHGDVNVRYPSAHGVGQDGPNAWMNQFIGDFDVGTFHINQTQSVLVILDGSHLRIRKPKSRVVSRRAMFDEEMDKTYTFVESRIYKLGGADISLVPPDIPRKRRWLWRLPIAIKLNDLQSIETLQEEIRQKQAKDEEKKDKEKETSARESVSPSLCNTLYLLPRSDREKEDWYWRLIAAAGKFKFPTMRPNLSPNLSTLNLLIHRVFYDVLTESSWEEVMRKKIQKKLSIIRLPYYIEEVQITDMDLGKHLPIISNVCERPRVDQSGIWIEMDFEYHGTVLMTLTTKLNLMKLKKEKDDNTESKNGVPLDTVSIASSESIGTTLSDNGSREKNRQYDSDEADEFDETSVATDMSKQKVVRLVEKITDSKTFQKLTEISIVRRAMENVSETDLCLTVVVERLAGRLAINIPHPPSDKIWYGFMQKPDLHMKAYPKLGEREVTFNQVTDWIEKKMTSEFHRLITFPNMDDASVPWMNSGLDDPEYRLAKLCDLILK